jgi:hypothetical protein
MSDEQHLTKGFIFDKLKNNAKLTSLLPNGADSIFVDERESVAWQFHLDESQLEIVSEAIVTAMGERDPSNARRQSIALVEICQHYLETKKAE